MQAIILAGGFGKRLREVVNDLPKPMASIRGVPFLSYILNQLDSSGFTKVVLAVGYLGNKIQDFYGYKFKNINISYSFEDHPLGTGGSVVKGLDLIEEDYFFVINGDTFFDIKFDKIKKPSNALIVCKYLKNTSRYGKVLFNEKNIVTRFIEKKSNNSGYINGGIYYLNKKIFYKYKLNSKFTLEKGFFEEYFNKINLEVHISDGYFIDIGIPEDYRRALNELKYK